MLGHQSPGLLNVLLSDVPPQLPDIHIDRMLIQDKHTLLISMLLTGCLIWLQTQSLIFFFMLGPTNPCDTNHFEICTIGEQCKLTLMYVLKTYFHTGPTYKLQQ